MKRAHKVRQPFMAHGRPVVPGSQWIIRRMWLECRVVIINHCRAGPGWWAYALDATGDKIRIRHSWELLRPAGMADSSRAKILDPPDTRIGRGNEQT
jgi:hypothetical protein